MVYDIKGDKNGCSRSYSSDFGISYSCDTNYSYLFQSTDDLCSKPEFKFTLSSAFHKL